MKKLNKLLNVIICASLALWTIQFLLAYNNYTRHLELFAAEGWVWYTDPLSWGCYIVPLVVAALIAKFVVRRKMG